MPTSATYATATPLKWIPRIAVFAGVWVGLTAIGAVDAARAFDASELTAASFVFAAIGGIAGFAVTAPQSGRRAIDPETALPMMTKAIVIVGAFAASWFIGIIVWPYDSRLATGDASTLEVVLVAVCNALLAAGVFVCMFLLRRSLPESVDGHVSQPSPALQDATLLESTPEVPTDPHPDVP